MFDLKSLDTLSEQLFNHPSLQGVKALAESLSVFKLCQHYWQNIIHQPQNAVTIKASIQAEQLDQVRDCLATISKDVLNNQHLPFSVFSDSLHFARFLILEPLRDQPNANDDLVFLANVDGSVDEFLSALVMKAGKGLDDIFMGCDQYPSLEDRNYATRLNFFRKHLVKEQAYYVNTLGRSVKQILAEDELQRLIREFLKTIQGNQFTSPQDVHKQVIKFMKKQPRLLWALSPQGSYSKVWKIKENLRFILISFYSLVISFLFWPLLLIWVGVLQLKEMRDPIIDVKPKLQRLDYLRSYEDIYAQNQFSAFGYLKPGIIRRTTVRVILFYANLSFRHIFNQGDLATIPLLGLDGVDTIHFARWILIDNDRRLLFASNYDGSLESYMGDFIDKVAWGLNLVFSNGENYPRTNWLVLDGARDEEKFKRFIDNHQTVSEVWYSPYGHLTAQNINDNSVIRHGLSRELSQSDAEKWLAAFD